MPDSNNIAVGAALNYNNGNVRVFSWDGTSWQQRGLDLDGQQGAERFGKSVSMPDVNTLGIGGYHYDGIGFGSGLVETYNWNGNAWVQRGSDILGDSAQDNCGFSISMPDADHLAIGYPQISADTIRGKVKAYEWSGNAWVQMGNTIIGENPDDAAGYSVSMPDPSTLAVGANLNDDGSIDAGHVRVFGISSSTGQNKIYSEPALSVHPSPASSFINISIHAEGNEVTDVSVLDLSGRELKINRTSEYPLMLDVSDYENGIYFVHLTMANSRVIGKFLVQHD